MSEALFLFCKVTGQSAAVYDPSAEEIAATQGPIGFKYR